MRGRGGDAPSRQERKEEPPPDPRKLQTQLERLALELGSRAALQDLLPDGTEVPRHRYFALVAFIETDDDALAQTIRNALEGFVRHDGSTIFVRAPFLVGSRAFISIFQTSEPKNQPGLLQDLRESVSHLDAILKAVSGMVKISVLVGPYAATVFGQAATLLDATISPKLIEAVSRILHGTTARDVAFGIDGVILILEAWKKSKEQKTSKPARNRKAKRKRRRRVTERRTRK